jgi:hypothetical protein
MPITPKGQQDRRWVKPLAARAPGKLDRFLEPRTSDGIPARYAHLRDVWDDRTHDGRPSTKERFAMIRDDPAYPAYKSRYRDMEPTTVEDDG